MHNDKQAVSTCIRGVVCSNLGWNKDYFDWCFRGISLYLPANSGIVLQIRIKPFPSTNFQMEIILPLDTMQWATERAVK
jgi:hypothetical protein